MIDNQLRQEILILGLDKLERQAKKNIFRACLVGFETNDYSSYDKAIQEYQEMENTMPVEFQGAKRLNDCRYKQVATIKNRNFQIVKDGKAIFLTLTFTDSVLAATSELTRRSYVSRFLKEQCSNYLANIDFGSKSEREHYHAIVKPLGKKIDLGKWAKYGLINAQRIKNTDADLVRTAKYVAKLTFHALKTVGQRYRLIFSRKQKLI